MPTFSRRRKAFNQHQILTDDGQILTVNTPYSGMYINDGQGQGLGPSHPQTSPLLFSQRKKNPLLSIPRRFQKTYAFHWKVSSNRINQASEGVPLGWRIDTDVAASRGVSFVVTTFHPAIGVAPVYQDGSSGETPGWRYFYGIQWGLNVNFDTSSPEQTIDYNPVTEEPYSEWTQDVSRGTGATATVDIDVRVVSPYTAMPYTYIFSRWDYSGFPSDVYGTPVGSHSLAGEWWPTIDIETFKQEYIAQAYANLSLVLAQLPPYTGNQYDILAEIPVTITNQNGIVTFSVTWDTNETSEFSFWFSGKTYTFVGNLDNYTITSKIQNQWCVPQLGPFAGPPLTLPEAYYTDVYPGDYYDPVAGTIKCFVIPGGSGGLAPSYEYWSGFYEIDPNWASVVVFDHAYQTFSLTTA